MAKLGVPPRRLGARGDHQALRAALVGQLVQHPGGRRPGQDQLLDIKPGEAVAQALPRPAERVLVRGAGILQGRLPRLVHADQDKERPSQPGEQRPKRDRVGVLGATRSIPTITQCSPIAQTACGTGASTRSASSTSRIE